MKKITRLMTLAVTVFALASCEDVPAPFGTVVPPKTEAGTTGIEPAGSGTAADPFNIAAAIEKCKEIGSTASTDKYYIKGIVVKGGTASGGYGNVSFDMGDTKDATTTFKAFQVAGTDGAKLPDGYTVNAGDEVVVYGPIYNYMGNTPETAGKSAAYIVSINGNKTGEGGGDTPQVGDVTKTVDGTTVTLTDTKATPSANSVTVDFNAQGWENAQLLSDLTLEDGTKITFAQGEGTTPPAFYAATKGVRIYAKNTITITSSTKPIAQAVLRCDSYNGTDYVGNSTLTASTRGNTFTIINDHTEAKGGTQLRVQTLTITYAQ